MLLASGNNSDVGPAIETSPTPEASPSAEPTTMIEVSPTPIVSDNGAVTSPNWSLIILLIIIVAAIGLIASLYLRNRQ